MAYGLLDPRLMGAPQLLSGLLKFGPEDASYPDHPDYPAMGGGMLGGQFPPAPQPGSMPQQQPQSGGFLDGLFGGGGDPNYALMALGQGIAGGDVAGSFGQYAPIMAKGRERNATKKWLMNKGMSPEDAEIYASNPSLLSEALQGKKRNLVNVGDGQLYDSDTGEWITAPNSGGSAKPPQIQELFDENGNPYKAQWNAQTGAWDKLGGSKPTGTTEAVRRNQQLYSVVEPEARNLAQKFDALATAGNQLSGIGGRIVGGLTGVDPSNYLTSPDYQSAKNSMKVIVANYLYSVSGATATPGEVENLSSSLLPSLGEDPQSVAEKKQRVQTMVEAIKKAGGGPNATVPAEGNPDDPLGILGP